MIKSRAMAIAMACIVSVHLALAQPAPAVSNWATKVQQLASNKIVTQSLGFLGLSAPLIWLYREKPDIFDSWRGITVGSLALASWMSLMGYFHDRSLPQVLKYTPTGKNKELCDALIKECSLDPAKVNVRYADTEGCIASMTDNTMIIDPALCHMTEEDPSAIEAQKVIAAYIDPMRSEIQKKRIRAIAAELNPAVQRYIVKHELGHLVQNYSLKARIRLLLISFCATYAGIKAAMATVPYNGWLAVATGIGTAYFVDTLSSYISNATWKHAEEKAADAFAIEHSSAADIEATADFWEKHQQILDANVDTNSIIRLPSRITSGHPNGKDRASYLRVAAAQK